jgi:hypothetical protein
LAYLIIIIIIQEYSKERILYYLIPAVAGSALVTKVPSTPKLIKLVLD